MTARHPALWPTVFALPAFLILVGLGTWQVQRLHWKEGVIAEREAGLAAPPLTLAEAPGHGEDVPFRRLEVTGNFLHDKEILLESQYRAGEPGYHVVTPLVLADGSTVLVDRGWIPRRLKDAASRAEGQVAGAATIAGVLRRPGRPSPWTPDNDPATGTWFFIDIDAAAGALNLPRLRPFIVEAGPAPNPGGYPVGGQTLVDLPNRHLEYALTWYSLAVVLLIIYSVFLRRRLQRA